MPADTLEKLSYSIRELAEATGLSVDSIYKAIRDKDLTTKKFGTKPLVLREEAERWLKSLPSD
jgi:excisionase family DNA binding protein